MRATAVAVLAGVLTGSALPAQADTRHSGRSADQRRLRELVDGMVRAGSNTKTFTAVVVLQLADEGRVRLDAPIEDCLPALVRGNGIDGGRITVRQLLRHTGGLPEYVSGLGDFFAIRDVHYEPDELLGLAPSQGAHGGGADHPPCPPQGRLAPHLLPRPPGAVHPWSTPRWISSHHPRRSTA
ncbi:serine hydrolase domain-containing protein [Streptomyces sp. NPDC044984]|uniref:serine hydrolase domain-containing protein n=1 Tax=Streptomyces sp. NPDC044984 TaxID=3154335 RepID=UPI00340CCABF